MRRANMDGRRDGTAARHRTSGVIRVMTFNIRYAEADDGENGWNQRRRLALARIRAFDPDLLGMQECSAGAQLSYVRRHLPDRDFLGVRTRDPDWPTELAPVFVKRDAFAITGSGHFWLSDTPSVPSKSWGAAFARTVTWTELRHTRTGRSMMFLNTHFDYQPEATVRSAQLLGAWISRAMPRMPVIVTGDFNAGKRSSAYRHLTRSRSGLRDVLREQRVPGRDAGSFHGYGTVNPPEAIDWILVSREFTVVSGTVDRHRDRERYASDHDPVTAVIGIRRRVSE
jgi:endonuclease/exonuclease/phosphatase family metal-dependent hydrolase